MSHDPIEKEVKGRKRKQVELQGKCPGPCRVNFLVQISLFLGYLDIEKGVCKNYVKSSHFLDDIGGL